MIITEKRQQAIKNSSAKGRLLFCLKEQKAHWNDSEVGQVNLRHENDQRSKTHLIGIPMRVIIKKKKKLKKTFLKKSKRGNRETEKKEREVRENQE